MTVNLIFVNQIFFSNGLLCVKDFGILMKRNSMATERKCNTIRKQLQDQQEKAALGHKVKIHQFFFSFTVTVVQCIYQYV